MESIDDLLASLKAEYEAPKQPLPAPSPPAASSGRSPLQDIGEDGEDPLIAELKAEYEAAHSPQPQKVPPSLPELFALETVYESPPTPAIFSTPITADSSLVNELKAEMVAEAQAAQQRQQEALQAAERQRKEALKKQAAEAEAAERQRKEALKKQAKAWLKQMKPNSEEGQWFADFAKGYPSPLDAAIDYLQALQEVESPEQLFQGWE